MPAVVLLLNLLRENNVAEISSVIQGLGHLWDKKIIPYLMFIFWENKTTERKSIYTILLCIDCGAKKIINKSLTS